MSRTVAYLKDSRPLDKWDDLQYPVLPTIEGNGRGDQIVDERELVVEQAEEVA